MGIYPIRLFAGGKRLVNVLVNVYKNQTGKIHHAFSSWVVIH
jgi:hypothetical protein